MVAVRRSRLGHRLFLSFPFLSFPFLSFPFLSFPFLSFPFDSFRFHSFPFDSIPFFSFPFISFPFCSFSFYFLFFLFPFLLIPFLSLLLPPPILSLPSFVPSSIISSIQVTTGFKLTSVLVAVKVHSRSSWKQSDHTLPLVTSPLMILALSSAISQHPKQHVPVRDTIVRTKPVFRKVECVI